MEFLESIIMDFKILMEWKTFRKLLIDYGRID